jgi:OPT family oligopeptide transporter
LCSEHQEASFTCPQARVFFNSSVVWGVIGPQRQFSAGQLYYPALFFFLLGAVLPIISWLILRKWKKSPIRHIHWPVFFNGMGYLPPATVYSYATYCTVGHVFGFWIKRKWFNWWAKYNYSLSAGLDLGLALGTLIIFLVLLSPTSEIPNWWGSDGAFNTADALFTPLKNVTNHEAFGPSSW